MADSIKGFGDSIRSGGSPEHQIERSDMSRTSNYNETVRANNRRYDKGAAGKRLPQGRVAAKQYRGKRGGSGR